MNLYAILRAARATAKASGNEGDFDRQVVLRKTIDRKVPHLREKFWERDEKARGRGEARMLFTDLLDMIQFRAGILNAAGNTEKTAVKVAATVTSDPASQTSPQSTAPKESPSPSYANVLSHNPPMQQLTIRYGICESFHNTVDCAILARIDADVKVKKLQEKRLCFHCLQHGHDAKLCPQKSSTKCIICQKAHHTILHGRTYPTPISHSTPQSMTSNDDTTTIATL